MFNIFELDEMYMQNVYDCLDILDVLKTMEKDGYNIDNVFNKAHSLKGYCLTDLLDLIDFTEIMLTSIFKNIKEYSFDSEELYDSGWEYFYDDIDYYNQVSFGVFNIKDYYIMRYLQIFKENNIKYLYDKKFLNYLYMMNIPSYGDEFSCLEFYLGDDRSGLWCVVSYCDCNRFLVYKGLKNIYNHVKSIVKDYDNNKSIHLSFKGYNGKDKNLIIQKNKRVRKDKFRKRSYYKRLEYKRALKLKGSGVIVK